MAAAFTAPAGLSIITTTFAEGPAEPGAGHLLALRRGNFSLGLVLSGLLTEISWRWTLLLPAPVAAVVLAAAARLVPRGDPAAPGRAGGFDLPGAAAVTTGMLLLVYAVTGAPQDGWASARTLLAFAAAAALLGAFVLIERRSRDPLVRLGIFRSPRAGPREPRRHMVAVRVVRLVPVPGHPVPADHGQLDGAGHRAGVPARGCHGGGRLHPDGPGHRPVRPGRSSPSASRAWPLSYTMVPAGRPRPPTIRR